MRNTYKLLLSCFLLLVQLQLTAQDKPTLYLGGGLNFPNTEAKNQTFINNNSALQLGAYVPFINKSTVSLGISVAGDYALSKNSYLNNSPEAIPVLGQISTVENAQAEARQKGFKLGVGPQLNFNLAKGFVISPIIQAGVNAIRQDAISFNQKLNTAPKETIAKEIYAQDAVESNNFFLSPKLRMAYPLFKNLGFWAETNYTISEVKQNRRVLVPLNPPREGMYSWGDLVEGSYRNETNTSKLNALGVNFGLKYSFGKDKLKKNAVKSIKDATPATLSGKKPAINKPGTIPFNNPAKKNQQELRKLVNVLPKNNAKFQDMKSIKSFSWKMMGTNIKASAYIIEVNRINGKGVSQRSYTAKTGGNSINVSAVFREDKIADGQYQWKVTEVSTGMTSTPSFFSISNCDIQFTINNEKIECLGYQGEDRKFKITFESTYSSQSGDLTYANTGSGLSVYDQSYNALSYTLVSPNPTLVTQVGATSSTVTYSFEVIAPGNVTAIGFGLQGDDLDPSPILCQPGVSLVLDELPDCLCKECEDMALTFNNFNISATNGAGNQFSFNGNINVNVPVYGLEFQVQSYSYTANPSPCTGGVTNIEESGMILMPGTTVNGSSTLQLYNESVSGSLFSNNSASKIIKYNSTSALTGAIPVNLNIGLPGPLQGLDASCCKITYTVCIKVKVYYDEAKCKSCVFTHCFEFTNQ